MNEKQLKTWLRNLAEAARQRGFSVEQWGESGDFPLHGFVRDGEPGAPRIYLSAGIHGDEPAGPNAIARLFEEGDFERTEAHWTLCPLLNPRGYAAGTRNTPEGIDLNRDYHALHAAETIAHVRWLANRAPHDLYLSLHEDWEAEGFYLYEINASPFPPLGERILQEVATLLPLERNETVDLHPTSGPGLIRHAPEPDEPGCWPEAIFHLKQSPHLSYTFETPSAYSIETRIRAHITAFRTAVRLFGQEYERSPGQPRRRDRVDPGL